MVLWMKGAVTHHVHLSQGAKIQRLPRRVFGKSVHFYGDRLGLMSPRRWTAGAAVPSGATC
jgi:hypothetical protein